MHKLKVQCASFENNKQHTRMFSITPCYMRRIIVLSMGQKKDLPQFSCIFHIFKYVIIFLRVRHSTSHFFTKSRVQRIFLDQYFPTQKYVL